MQYVRVPAPAGLEDVFPDGVEIRKDLYDSGDEAAINQAIIQLGGDVIPMTAMDRRMQFAKGFTSTLRGLGEATGIIEQDQSQEMRDRMQREGDLGAEAAYYAGAIAEFIPATAIKALTIPFQAVKNPVVRTALEFGAIGAAIGGAQPVYEQLGDDRIKNALTAGGVGAPLGAAVGKLMSSLGAKTEAEFLAKWEEATPEQQMQLEKLADELIPLETRETQMARQSADNAAAAETELTKQAEVEAIRKQGDALAAERADADFAAKVEEDFAANLAEQRRLTENMNLRDTMGEVNAARQADYDKQLGEIGASLRTERLKELETTMKSIIAPKQAKAYDAEIKAAKGRVRYWQKQLDEMVAGTRKKGSNGRTGTQVREERLNAKKDLETLQTIQKRSATREAAVKEYVQLKKNGKSPVVEQRLAEAAGKIEKPVRQEPAQIPPRQPELTPEAVDPSTLRGIPEQVRGNINTPRNAAGSVERLTPANQRPVNRAEYEAQQAAYKQAEAKAQVDRINAAGGGRVPPQGTVPPQGAANVPPQGAAQATAKDQSRFAEGVDKFFGSLSTRIGNISQEILGRARMLEYNISTKNAEHIKRIEPFLRHMSKRIPPNMREEITMKLFNGDHAEVMKMLPPDMRKEFYEVKKVL